MESDIVNVRYEVLCSYRAILSLILTLILSNFNFLKQSPDYSDWSAK